MSPYHEEHCYLWTISPGPYHRTTAPVPQDLCTCTMPLADTCTMPLADTWTMYPTRGQRYQGRAAAASQGGWEGWWCRKRCGGPTTATPARLTRPGSRTTTTGSRSSMPRSATRSGIALVESVLSSRFRSIRPSQWAYLARTRVVSATRSVMPDRPTSTRSAPVSSTTRPPGRVRTER